jgi:isorenieratene synthase
LAPDWQQCNPGWIARGVARALTLPSGGWYVIDAARAIGDGPRCYRIGGQAWVVWRAGDAFRVAPNACPHLGASLADGRIEAGKIVCPWHGLALGEAPRGTHRVLPVHHDGVLVWVRLDDGEAPTPAPILPARPARRLDAVIRKEARCEPEDVIANRLDPWHGAHFHPHSFGRLRVIDQTDGAITVRVVYRVVGRIGIEVDARFHCPERRSIVMTIVSGEGEGSVVETHATPIDEGRTAIVEATLATSERAGFRAARLGACLLRPLIQRAAHRLWVEDAAYAERLYALRRGEG